MLIDMPFRANPSGLAGRSNVVNLDANANATPTRAVIAAVVEAMSEGAGNPSSGHLAGDLARSIVERARDSVASLLDGVIEEGVTFTSGCTEANNTVLRGLATFPRYVLITSVVEHASVLKVAELLGMQGADVHRVKVDSTGVLDLAQLEALLSHAGEGCLLSVQVANSETGVIQPIEAIAELAQRYGAVFHADAAQSFGKLRTNLACGRGPDVITVSGHKLHAPAGVGAIIARSPSLPLRPLVVGGDQEHGRRAGTQSVPLLAGFAAACKERALAFSENVERMRRLRDRLERGILDALPSTRVNGGAALRLPNSSNLLFRGVDGMALVANLDAQGVLASQGSACSNRRPEPSHVLTAMGLSKADAFSSVRFSVSPLNTEEEIDRAVQIIVTAASQLRMRP